MEAKADHTTTVEHVTAFSLAVMKRELLIAKDVKKCGNNFFQFIRSLIYLRIIGLLPYVNG